MFLGAPEDLTPTATPVPGVAANDLTAVLNHVNANAAAGHFTWLLGENIPVAGDTTRGLNQTDARLTIIGIGQERTISLTSAGRIFTLGADGQTGISLTLGNNVALVGLANNTTGLARTQNAAALTMLEGSEIRGNTSSGTSVANDLGAAVNVQESGSFTMRGGRITGNHSMGGASGLRAGVNTVITLAGGSITGNTTDFIGGAGIFIASPAASVTLSGTAAVGTLMLVADNATTRGSLIIATGWTGTVAELHLLALSPNIVGAINLWNNNAVLTGPGVNATTVGQITLGNFIPGLGAPQPITDTHRVNASGVLVEN